MRIEIRIAGFGGQGVIRAGLMLAMAAALYSGKKAVQTQSYGPESRGGACKSEVVISEEEIDYPKVLAPDVLILMSQHAYDVYIDTVKTGGTVLLDPDMIPSRKEKTNIEIYEVPATKIAEKLGKTIAANVVMIGAFSSITKLLDAEALKKSVLANVPKGTEDFNLKAFEEGYQYGKQLLERANPN